MLYQLPTCYRHRHGHRARRRQSGIVYLGQWPKWLKSQCANSFRLLLVSWPLQTVTLIQVNYCSTVPSSQPNEFHQKVADVRVHLEDLNLPSRIFAMFFCRLSLGLILSTWHRLSISVSVLYAVLHTRCDDEQ